MEKTDGPLLIHFTELKNRFAHLLFLKQLNLLNTLNRCTILIRAVML